MVVTMSLITPKEAIADILRLWEVSRLEREEKDQQVARLERESEEKDRQIAFLKDSHDAIRELAYKTGAQEEREACIKVCLEQKYGGDWSDCADAIRAREENEDN